MYYKIVLKILGEVNVHPRSFFKTEQRQTGQIG